MDMESGKKFGFGCMRMPVLNPGAPSSFDYEKIEKIFGAFLTAGFVYFDTAYTYHNYEAEKAVKKCLVDRYPRESFELATKMPLRDFKDEADLETIFNEQLTNCGVEYFDYYLLHNMGHNVYAKCCKYHAFEFVARKKSEGRANFVGMSFHDTPELLEEILTKYGDKLDFLQLQINYIDWEQPNVQSKRCLEIANKFNKPVIVMEPCKGGTLVNVPEEARRLMEAYNPKASMASWALRFAASQKGVIRVLSGMNSLEQVEDNTAAFKNFVPLNHDEMDIIVKVTGIINASVAVPCTACGYCTKGCPKNIPIPQDFALYNSVMRTTGSFSSQMVYYNNLIQAGKGKASDCIKCGKCESACPQHLPIRKFLEDVVEKFEKNSIVPTRKQKEGKTLHITAFSQKYHEKMFPGYKSDFLRTDPEFIERFDNFCFDEVLNEDGVGLEDRPRFLAILATLLGSQAVDEFKCLVPAALSFGLTPVEIKEVIYQAVPYLGIGRVFPFLKSINSILEERGVTLPLAPKATTTTENRLEAGEEAQIAIFGDAMQGFSKSGPKATVHIRKWLTDNCFGDYYTRGGLDYRDREMLTFCFLAAQGGCEPQLTSHAKANIRLGNSKEFLIKVVSQCLPYIGYPRSLNALRCVEEADK